MATDRPVGAGGGAVAATDLGTAETGTRALPTAFATLGLPVERAIRSRATRARRSARVSPGGGAGTLARAPAVADGNAGPRALPAEATETPPDTRPSGAAPAEATPPADNTTARPNAATDETRVPNPTMKIPSP